MHALRNALIPVVTTIGLQVGTLLAGAILTETIFSWPGVGKWLVEAIHRRDYPAVQGGILLLGDDRHRRQPARRPALRRHQPADQACLTPRHSRAQQAAAEAARPPAPWLALWRDFRRNRGAVVGLAVVLGLVLTAVLANVIAPYDPTEQYRDATLRPPSLQPVGGHVSCSAPTRSAATSCRGCIHGTRLSLLIGAFAVGSRCRAACCWAWSPPSGAAAGSSSPSCG